MRMSGGFQGLRSEDGRGWGRGGFTERMRASRLRDVATYERESLFNL